MNTQTYITSEFMEINLLLLSLRYTFLYLKQFGFSHIYCDLSLADNIYK